MQQFGWMPFSTQREQNSNYPGEISVTLTSEPGSRKRKIVRFGYNGKVSTMAPFLSVFCCAF